MLRITPTCATRTRATYVLAGEITEDQVPRLERLVRSALRTGSELTFDLSGVWRVDRIAARWLAPLMEHPGPHVRLDGVAMGLRAWLRDEGHEGAEQSAG